MIGLVAAAAAAATAAVSTSKSKGRRRDRSEMKRRFSTCTCIMSTFRRVSTEVAHTAPQYHCTWRLSAWHRELTAILELSRRGTQVTDGTSWMQRGVPTFLVYYHAHFPMCLSFLSHLAVLYRENDESGLHDSVQCPTDSFICPTTRSRLSVNPTAAPDTFAICPRRRWHHATYPRLLVSRQPYLVLC